MDYLLDTNIVLHLVRESLLATEVTNNFSFFKYPQKLFISVVVKGELKSLALKNKWGKNRMEKLSIILEELIIVDINSEDIIQRYAEIDAYSQGKLENRPTSFSARNMGKNDLWIAATASVLNTPLMTTYSDFQHLDKEFLELICIEQTL